MRMITYKPREYEIAPEGCYRARLESIDDAAPGTNARGEEVQRVKFCWMLTTLVTSTGEPFKVYQTYNLTLAPRSFLHQAIVDISGAEPGQSFDLDTLVGAECDLVLRHNAGADGRTWCNIRSILRPATPAEKAEEQRVVAATEQVRQAALRNTFAPRNTPHIVSRPAPTTPAGEDTEDIPF
jgi:hypothetical protein